MSGGLFIRTDGVSVTTQPIPFTEGIEVAQDKKISFSDTDLTYIGLDSGANRLDFIANDSSVDGAYQLNFSAFQPGFIGGNISFGVGTSGLISFSVDDGNVSFTDSTTGSLFQMASGIIQFQSGTPVGGIEFIADLNTTIAFGVPGAVDSLVINPYFSITGKSTFKTTVELLASSATSFVVSGALNIATNGSPTTSTFDSKVIIDVTTTNALLVRQNGGGSTVLNVDTTLQAVTINSGAGATSGVFINLNGAKFEVIDSSTLSSITVFETGVVTLDSDASAMNIYSNDIITFGNNLGLVSFTIDPGAGTSVITVPSTSSFTMSGLTASRLVVTTAGKVLASGSTIAGSYTWSDPQIFSSTVTYEGATLIDVTDPEAFLVRKNGDTGDVFTVDTTTPAVKFGVAGTGVNASLFGTTTSGLFWTPNAVSGSPKLEYIFPPNNQYHIRYSGTETSAVTAQEFIDVNITLTTSGASNIAALFDFDLTDSRTLSSGSTESKNIQDFTFNRTSFTSSLQAHIVRANAFSISDFGTYSRAAGIANFYYGIDFAGTVAPTISASSGSGTLAFVLVNDGSSMATNNSFTTFTRYGINLVHSYTQILGLGVQVGFRYAPSVTIIGGTSTEYAFQATRSGLGLLSDGTIGTGTTDYQGGFLDMGASSDWRRCYEAANNAVENIPTGAVYNWRSNNTNLATLYPQQGFGVSWSQDYGAIVVWKAGSFAATNTRSGAVGTNGSGVSINLTTSQTGGTHNLLPMTFSGTAMTTGQIRGGFITLQNTASETPGLMGYAMGFGRGVAGSAPAGANNEVHVISANIASSTTGGASYLVKATKGATVPATAYTVQGWGHYDLLDNNTWDIASSTNKIRAGYFGTSINIIPGTESATAFLIEETGGNDIFLVDNSTPLVAIGTASTLGVNVSLYNNAASKGIFWTPNATGAGNPQLDYAGKDGLLSHVRLGGTQTASDSSAWKMLEINANRTYTGGKSIVQAIHTTVTDTATLNASGAIFDFVRAMNFTMNRTDAWSSNQASTHSLQGIYFSMTDEGTYTGNLSPGFSTQLFPIDGTIGPTMSGSAAQGYALTVLDFNPGTAFAGTNLANTTYTFTGIDLRNGLTGTAGASNPDTTTARGFRFRGTVKFIGGTRDVRAFSFESTFTSGGTTGDLKGYSYTPTSSGGVFTTEYAFYANRSGLALVADGTSTLTTGTGGFLVMGASSDWIRVYEADNEAVENIPTGAVFDWRVNDVDIMSLSSTNLTLITNAKLTVAGNGLYIKEGTNATMGVSTLVGGTIVVLTTKVTATSRIMLTNNTLGGTAGFLRVSARTAGTSFTILSSNGADTSQIAWVILEPA